MSADLAAREMVRKRTISSSGQRGNECVLVARAVASSIETLLGPGKSLKCCESSGTSLMTSSTSKILESVDIEHPAGFIINTACQGFHKQFGCGCTTLVCLIGYWAKTMHGLTEMGVPTPVIAAMMDEAFEELESVFKKSFITLQSLQDKVSISHNSMSFKSEVLVDNRQPERSCSPEQFTRDKIHPDRKLGRSATEISDKCEELFWRENFEATERDCQETEPISSLEQSAEVFSETERLTGCVSGGRKLDTKYGTRYKSTLSERFVPVPANGVSFEKCRSTAPAHEEPVLVDEFDACFDEVKKEDEAVGACKTATNTTTFISAIPATTKDARVSSKSSGKSRIQELLNNMVLPNQSTRQTNTAKVFRRSRHLVDNPATKLDQLASSWMDHGSQSSQILSEDRNLTRNPDDRLKGYLNQDNSLVTREHETEEELDKYNQDVICSDRSHAVTHRFDLLARNLAHGKESEMKFASEILDKQFTASAQSSNKFTFSLDFITVQTIVGPPSSNSCVLEGVVVLLSKRNQSILERDYHKPRRIMLVNGDIASNYRHAGLKASVEVTHVLGQNDSKDASLSERSKWIGQVTSLVQNMNVGVVAARGNVDENLRDSLQGLGVIVLENLSHRQLESLSKMTETSIVTYPFDIVACDLGEPVVASVRISGWSSGNRVIRNVADVNGAETITFAQIHLCVGEKNRAKTNHMTQTLILCGPVSDLVYDSELKFWNCANRLRNAFDDQRVLPGGGEIEQLCVKHLSKVIDSSVSNKIFRSRSLCQWTSEDCTAFRPLVYGALNEGLKEFISKMNKNVTRDSASAGIENFAYFSSTNPRNCVFDNYICKLEGWKRAMRVVKLLLFSEYHIVTGI